MAAPSVYAARPGTVRIPGEYMINFNPATNPSHPGIANLPPGTMLKQVRDLVLGENGLLCEEVCTVRCYIVLCKEDPCGPGCFGELQITKLAGNGEDDDDIDPANCVEVGEMVIEIEEG